MATATAIPRLLKELSGKVPNIPPDVRVASTGDSTPLQVRLLLRGPPELSIAGKAPRPSPYAGRTFEVIVTVPESYPHSPPKSVVFTGGTLYHPSVKWGGGGGGEVPGELCPMTYTKTWTATMSMFSLGSLIIEHLKAPNLAEPREAELAMEAADRLDEFVAKATAAAAKLPAWPGGTEGSAGGGGGGGGGGR